MKERMKNHVRHLKDVFGKRAIGRECLLFVGRTLTDIKTISKFARNWKNKEIVWPNNMIIEPANVCNANCIFCAYQYQAQWRPQKGLIADDIFRKAVDSHFENGGTFISLTSPAGEGLIDPNLVSKIKYITDKGMTVSFFTNGILLNEIDVNALIESGLHSIVISTAPLKQQYFEAIYRSKNIKNYCLGLKNYCVNAINIIITLKYIFLLDHICLIMKHWGK